MYYDSWTVLKMFIKNIVVKHTFIVFKDVILTLFKINYSLKRKAASDEFLKNLLIKISFLQSC